MKALGLDIGDRRVGVAVSDACGILACPHSVYHRAGEDDGAELAAMVRTLEVDQLVVGLPLNMDGSEGAQAQKARALGERVAELSGLPLAFVDERLTTHEAERVLREAGLPAGRRGDVQDAVAAVLILQTWLDQRRVQSSRGDPLLS